MAIILFDGVCNLCNAFIRWIIQRDRRAHFKFAALQSEAGRGAISAYTIPEEETVLLVEDGSVYVKSEAALRIIRRLGWLGRLSPILRLIPRRMRDGVYDFVARNRYGWFGRRDRCMIPTDDVRPRFLD
jgi:predicted DCC family thiol-disulfide oxidoreductase YuxK